MSDDGTEIIIDNPDGTVEKKPVRKKAQASPPSPPADRGKGRAGRISKARASTSARGRSAFKR